MRATDSSEAIRILLIEDDEDDYILARSLLEEIRERPFQLEWAKSYRAGLDSLLASQPDVCLVDYRLGAETGIDLLRAAIERGCQAPIILLTGQGEHEIDLEAMQAGAADYLVKGRLDAGLLERSIRYAIGRSRAALKAAAEQARLAAFGADIGLALTRRDSLEAILAHCAAAMVNYLHVVLVRLWGCDTEDKKLHFLATAGISDGEEQAAIRLPKLKLDLDVLAQGQALIINNLVEDSRLRDIEWAKREEICAFAAYPLRLEDRLVGLVTLFSRSPLSQSILQEMGSVANGIALCIERKRSEEALDASEVKYRSVVENIKEVIFQTDGLGRWTFLNPAWAEITGHSVKETLGTPFADYMHPEDREHTLDLIQQVIERRTSFCRAEARYLAKDGTFRWVEVYAQPTLDSHVYGTSGTLSDITERKRAEAEIQKLAAFPRYNPDPTSWSWRPMAP